MAMKRVTIFGGSGFLGKYITRKYAQAGYRVRVAVRRPNEALFVRTYGRVGQVEPIQANVRDELSVKRAVEGADLVINVAGILAQSGKQTFDAVNVEGAERVARLSKAAGVAQFIHVSGVGADVEASSRLSRSQAAGELAVQDHYKNALIVRPTTLFGVEDHFMNRWGKALAMFPIFAVPCPQAKTQPVYVDDVADFVFEAADKGLKGTFELGGADVFTQREIADLANQLTARKRILISLPGMLGTAKIWGAYVLQICTFGIFKTPFLTPDESKRAVAGDVVSGQNGFDKLKMSPTALEPIAKKYLEMYRPRGQFEKLVQKKL